MNSLEAECAQLTLVGILVFIQHLHPVKFAFLGLTSSAAKLALVIAMPHDSAFKYPLRQASVSNMLRRHGLLVERQQTNAGRLSLRLGMHLGTALG